MKNLLYIFCFILLSKTVSAQILIAANNSVYNKPDDSAVLQVEDSNRGFLMPRISSSSNITSPSESVMFYNTGSKKFNFWSENNWNKMFETSDANSVIDVTTNYVGNSTAKTVVTTFPNTMPSFTIGSNLTSDWTYLGATTNFAITKTNNSTLITVEGMSQINNNGSGAGGTNYQFAIGVFVNDKLLLVRKYFKYSAPNSSCAWKKFNVAGVFENLATNNNYVVKIYAYNLPKLNNPNSYNSVTYGGNGGTCNNLNESMARVFVSAQVAETGN